MSIHSLLQRLLPALALTAVVLIACSPATAAGPELRATDAWARPVTMHAANSHHHAGTGNSAVYLTLMNDGNAPDRLLGVTTDVARVAEIHESFPQPNGAMGMRPVESVELPARERVSLRPGGLHVMLIDVQRDLHPGESFTLELHFEQSPALTIPVTVREP